jgi:hypothetical protein
LGKTDTAVDYGRNNERQREIVSDGYNRWFASTKDMSLVQQKNKLILEERRYTCGCGYFEEREESGRILQEEINILAGRG